MCIKTVSNHAQINIRTMAESYIIQCVRWRGDAIACSMITKGIAAIEPWTVMT